MRRFHLRDAMLPIAVIAAPLVAGAYLERSRTKPAPRPSAQPASGRTLTYHVGGSW